MNSTFAFILPYSSNLESFLNERRIAHKVYGFNGDDKDFIRISTNKITSESEESTAFMLGAEYQQWLSKSQVSIQGNHALIVRGNETTQIVISEYVMGGAQHLTDADVKALADAGIHRG